MKIRLRAFGIAKDILSAKELDYDLHESKNIIGLRIQLSKDYPEFNMLSSIRFAINETYVGDEAVLNDNDEVILIPPVSGG